jgi:hypoxanthine phosphoribosyltransferase
MPAGIQCELITWEHFHELARRLSRIVHAASFRPDVIVAIARGGCVPARMLSDYLDIFDVDAVKIEHYHGIHMERSASVRYPLNADITGKRVLLVDDVSDTGDSFELAVRHLRERGEPAALKTASLHHKTVSAFVPDFCAEIVTEWRWIIYPWAVMEDLRSLRHKMDPQPATVDEFGRYLKQQHGIEPDRRALEDVFSIPVC